MGGLSPLRSGSSQQKTSACVETAFVDQGYTGAAPTESASVHGIAPVVAKLQEAKRGFAARFRRFARDYERLPTSLADLHWLAFLTLMLSALFRQSA